MRSSSTRAAATRTTDASVSADLVAAGALLLVASLVLIPSLWSPGIVNPVDFLMSVHRIMELDTAWAQGIYYPRLGPDFNFGYGAPLFQFYPPLASYLGLLFHWLGLGYIAAAKAVLSLSLLLAGLGAYAFGRTLLRWRPAALAAGLLYLASPYLLLVMYERGAVAEMVVWGVAPWLFWAAHRFHASGQRRDGLLTAVAVALVFLAHNATALFLLPGAALYVALLAFSEGRVRALWPVAAAFVLGAALSAFYWLPAMVEVRHTIVEQTMFSGATEAVNNVVPPAQVMQYSLVPQFGGDERFRLSLWQFVLGMLGAVAALASGRRSPPGLRILAVGLFLLLLLQTTWSIPFWEHVPVVRYIQFPWRLHGLISLGVALLAAGLLLRLQQARPALRAGGLAAAAMLGALLVWASTLNMHPENSQIWAQMGEDEVTRLAMWERGRNFYPLWSDYTVQTLELGSTGLTASRAPDEESRLPATYTPQILVQSSNPVRTLLDVDAPEPWTLRMHNGWFPGWQIRIDGKAVPTTAEGTAGLVSAALPAGRYTVQARLEDSAVRMLATLLSIVAVALWVAWAVRPGRSLVTLLVVAGVAAGLALGVRLLTVEAKPGIEPRPFRATFDNGITLLGYDVENSPLCIGDSLHLRTWWHVRETPTADFKFFVHVATLDDSGKVAQADAFPADGYIPMTRWEAGELVPEAQQVLLEGAIPPGTWQVILGMYDPVVMQNARVLDAPAVLPGDRLPLTQLEIRACP